MPMRSFCVAIAPNVGRLAVAHLGADGRAVERNHVADRLDRIPARG
jgi:hypothetical protein